MSLIEEVAISPIDWSALRTDSGSGVGLPSAVRDLANASSESAAEAAYWRIDNEAVVQGELYEAAEPVLAALLWLGAEMPDGPAKKSIAELIQQIVCGQPAESEVAAGNGAVGDRCRQLAAGGLWLFYGWLASTDDDIRQCALLIINRVDSDGLRKRRLFSALRSGFSSFGILKILDLIDAGKL